MALHRDADTQPVTAVGGDGTGPSGKEDEWPSSDASLEELLTDMIGKPTGRSKVVVERGPVSQFAAAVGSTSPIYRDLDAAKAAGFAAIPAPPTWPFAMEFAGKFEEIQPVGADTASPLTAALGRLMAERRPDPPR